MIQAKGPADGASQAVARTAPRGFAGQPAAATAVVAGARRSADPFGFDDDPEPVTAPRPKGKGWIIATVLLVSLSTVAVLVGVPRAAVARAVPRQAD